MRCDVLERADPPDLEQLFPMGLSSIGAKGKMRHPVSRLTIGFPSVMERIFFSANMEVDQALEKHVLRSQISDAQIGHFRSRLAG